MSDMKPGETKRMKYFEKILRRRRKEVGKQYDVRSLIVYDAEVYSDLTLLARNKSTTVSAILNNLYEDFLVRITESESGRKPSGESRGIMDYFKVDDSIPRLNADTTTWENYLSTLDHDGYKEFNTYLTRLIHLCNKHGDDLHK